MLTSPLTSPLLSSRPRLSVGRLLADLGGRLLSPGHSQHTGETPVGGVVIYDPLDQLAWPAGAIVLGIGLHGPDQIIEALNRSGARDAAVLVVADPLPGSSEIAEASARTGVAVLGRADTGSWMQLNTILDTLVAADQTIAFPGETFAGIPTGDLFALANAVAALLDAPITIEDRNSRLLAFSGRQDEADQSRVSTILSRQVSADNLRTLHEHGVFEKLYCTDGPVLVDAPGIPIHGFTVPRVAIAIRAGDEVLGSLWAALPGRLTRDRIQAFRDVAKLVALHMLSQRAGSDVKRQLRAELVEAALDGGPGYREAVRQLGLLGQPALVLALAVPDAAAGPDASRASDRQLLADAFAMHLTAAHPQAVSSLVGEIAYGVLPVQVENTAAQRRAVRLSTDFLRRTGGRAHALIGIGSIAAKSSGLARSRQSAERALRALQFTNCSKQVASIDEVYVEALLLELREIIDARDDAVRGPVARLADYDRKHRTCLVKTLQSWLDNFGDVTDASAAVGVHANTFRYRLRRLAAVAEIDLADADTRFAAMLELRVLQEAG